MTAAIRLPVAPRPFRDELLSSWMVRVASRYGLEVPDMTAYMAENAYFFVIFILIGSFFLLNFFIGVLFLKYT